MRSSSWFGVSGARRVTGRGRTRSGCGCLYRGSTPKDKPRRFVFDIAATNLAFDEERRMHGRPAEPTSTAASGNRNRIPSPKTSAPARCPPMSRW